MDAHQSFARDTSETLPAEDRGPYAHKRNPQSTSQSDAPLSLHGCGTGNGAKPHDEAESHSGVDIEGATCPAQSDNLPHQRPQPDRTASYAEPGKARLRLTSASSFDSFAPLQSPPVSSPKTSIAQGLSASEASRLRVTDVHKEHSVPHAKAFSTHSKNVRFLNDTSRLLTWISDPPDQPQPQAHKLMPNEVADRVKVTPGQPSGALARTGSWYHQELLESPVKGNAGLLKRVPSAQFLEDQRDRSEKRRLQDRTRYSIELSALRAEISRHIRKEADLRSQLEEKNKTIAQLRHHNKALQDLLHDADKAREKTLFQCLEQAGGLTENTRRNSRARRRASPLPGFSSTETLATTADAGSPLLKERSGSLFPLRLGAAGVLGLDEELKEGLLELRAFKPLETPVTEWQRSTTRVWGRLSQAFGAVPIPERATQKLLQVAKTRLVEERNAVREALHELQYHQIRIMKRMMEAPALYEAAKSELRNVVDQLDQSNRLLEAKERDLIDSRHNMTVIRDKFDTSQHALKETCDTLNALRDEFNLFKTQSRLAVETSQKDYDVLLRQLHTTRDRLEDTLSTLNTKDTVIEKLNRDANLTHAEKERLLKSNESLKTDVASLQQFIKATQTTLQALETSEAEKLGDIQHLRSALEEASRMRNSLEKVVRWFQYMRSPERLKRATLLRIQRPSLVPQLQPKTALLRLERQIPHSLSHQHGQISVLHVSTLTRPRERRQNIIVYRYPNASLSQSTQTKRKTHSAQQTQTDIFPTSPPTLSPRYLEKLASRIQDLRRTGPITSVDALPYPKICSKASMSSLQLGNVPPSIKTSGTPLSAYFSTGIQTEKPFLTGQPCLAISLYKTPPNHMLRVSTSSVHLPPDSKSLSKSLHVLPTVTISQPQRRPLCHSFVTRMDIFPTLKMREPSALTVYPPIIVPASQVKDESRFVQAPSTDWTPRGFSEPHSDNIELERVSVGETPKPPIEHSARRYFHQISSPSSHVAPASSPLDIRKLPPIVLHREYHSKSAVQCARYNLLEIFLHQEQKMESAHQIQRGSQQRCQSVSCALEGASLSRSITIQQVSISRTPTVLQYSARCEWTLACTSRTSGRSRTPFYKRQVLTLIPTAQPATAFGSPNEGESKQPTTPVVLSHRSKAELVQKQKTPETPETLNTLKRVQSKELSKLQQQYCETISELKTSHAAELLRLRQEHDNATEKQERLYSAARDKLHNEWKEKLQQATAEQTNIKNALRTSQERVEALEETNRHALEKNQILQSRLRELQDEYEKKLHARCEALEAAVKIQEAAFERQLETQNRERTQAFERLRTQHQRDLQSLQEKLQSIEATQKVAQVELEQKRTTAMRRTQELCTELEKQKIVVAELKASLHQEKQEKTILERQLHETQEDLTLSKQKPPQIERATQVTLYETNELNLPCPNQPPLLPLPYFCHQRLPPPPRPPSSITPPSPTQSLRGVASSLRAPLTRPPPVFLPFTPSPAAPTLLPLPTTSPTMLSMFKASNLRNPPVHPVVSHHSSFVPSSSTDKSCQKLLDDLASIREIMGRTFGASLPSDFQAYRHPVQVSNLSVHSTHRGTALAPASLNSP